MSEKPNEAASSADFEFEALNEARNYRKALIKEFAPFLKGSVIEVGAGIGQITELLREQQLIDRLLCIEPCPEFCARFRSKHPQQSLIAGTIENVNEKSWHAILSVNVLEHILEDTRELARYQRLLVKQNGHLCLFVPARPEIYAAIDRDFGHHRRYTSRDLGAKLTDAGFLIRKLKYFNSAGYFAWWFNFRLMRKRSFDARGVRFFDRTIFPFVHALEANICRPPFGQSLLAIATACSDSGVHSSLQQLSIRDEDLKAQA